MQEAQKGNTAPAFRKELFSWDGSRREKKQLSAQLVPVQRAIAKVITEVAVPHQQPAE